MSQNHAMHTEASCSRGVMVALPLGPGDRHRYMAVQMEMPVLPRLLHAICVCCVACNAASADDEFRPLSVSLVPDANFVAVAGTIKTHKLLFVVDTGSTFSVLDERHASLLNGSLREHDALPDGMRYSNSLNELQISGTPFSTRFFVADLSGFSKHSSFTIDGLLGMDVLREHVISLNFDADTLTIARKYNSANGHAKELTYSDSGTPHLQDDQNARVPIDYLIDTGMNIAVSLDESEFVRVANMQSITQIRPATSLKIGERTSVKMGVFTEFQIGPITLANIRVANVSPNRLGIGLLNRFNVTLDFVNDKIYFVPRDSGPKAD